MPGASGFELQNFLTHLRLGWAVGNDDNRPPCPFNAVVFFFTTPQAAEPPCPDTHFRCRLCHDQYFLNARHWLHRDTCARCQKIVSTANQAEFECPLCQLHVPFGHDYAEGVGPDETRSAMCPKCNHCFAVSPSDVCYARETVRRIKNLTKSVRRKVHPCKYAHTQNLCQAPECRAP